jgi:2-dehydropantoate 2-reductase
MPEVLPILKRLQGNFKIIVLQNGLDNEEHLAEFFTRDRILRTAVNYAGNIVSPGIIKMNFFQEPNRIGCICKDKNCRHAFDIAGIMNDAALLTEVATDIREFTWKKAILNAILAPIAAILGITMADVMADPKTRHIVESLIRESIAIAKEAGYYYGDDFFDRCVDFLLKAGKHKPSMLIDLENGNPTEVDYINGKIAEYGKMYNIPAPFNTTMAALVKAKENLNLNFMRRN